MKCFRCGKPFYECKAMHPIDPPGTKGRRWVCIDCETPDENALVDPEVKKFERIIMRGSNQ